jgi:hypothetical protein
MNSIGDFRRERRSVGSLSIDEYEECVSLLAINEYLEGHVYSVP